MSFERLPSKSPIHSVGEKTPASGDTKITPSAGSSADIAAYLQSPVCRVSDGPVAGRAELPVTACASAASQPQETHSKAIQSAEVAVHAAIRQVDDVQAELNAVAKEHDQLKIYLNGVAEHKGHLQYQLAVMTSRMQELRDSIVSLNTRSPEVAGHSSYKLAVDEHRGLGEKTEFIDVEIKRGEYIEATEQPRLTRLTSRKVGLSGVRDALTQVVNTRLATLNAARAQVATATLSNQQTLPTAAANSRAHIAASATTMPTQATVEVGVSGGSTVPDLKTKMAGLLTAIKLGSENIKILQTELDAVTMAYEANLTTVEKHYKYNDAAAQAAKQTTEYKSNYKNYVSLLAEKKQIEASLSKELKMQAEARKEFIKSARTALGEPAFGKAEAAAEREVTHAFKLQATQVIETIYLSEHPDPNYGTARTREQARALQGILEKELQDFLQ
jgi:hypothetical protein